MGKVISVLLFDHANINFWFVVEVSYVWILNDSIKDLVNKKFESIITSKFLK